ncbi:hypothetical protein N0V91_008913 [Didymella pomorum]|uniref:Uncharacterized protein n=1 Tax=Didymella pomorum TaxID=749634 RepID=A0A9W8Z660_9PLEO|nr:hypothetical protein N0V91_008913 [Didymella pomorum]
MHRSLPTEKAFGITCFFEELQIVPKHSATLPSYNAIGIRANHMDMSKYTSLHDPGYQAVSGEIRRWLKEIKSRRDTARLVYNAPIALEEPTSQSHQAYAERTPPIIREPTYVHSNTLANNRTPEHAPHGLSHRAEPVQPLLYNDTKSRIPNHALNDATQQNFYAYPDNRAQNHTLYELPRNYSRTPVPDRTPNYVPSPPADQYQGTHSQEFTRGHATYELNRNFSSAHADYIYQNDLSSKAASPYSPTATSGDAQSNDSLLQEERGPQYNFPNARFDNGGVGVSNISGGVGVNHGGIHHHHGAAFHDARRGQFSREESVQRTNHVSGGTNNGVNGINYGTINNNGGPSFHDINGAYQGANKFGNVDNSGKGRVLQGNYNSAGDMKFSFN